MYNCKNELNNAINEREKKLVRKTYKNAITRYNISDDLEIETPGVDCVFNYNACKLNKYLEIKEIQFFDQFLDPIKMNSNFVNRPPLEYNYNIQAGLLDGVFKRFSKSDPTRAPQFNFSRRVEGPDFERIDLENSPVLNLCNYDPKTKSYIKKQKTDSYKNIITPTTLIKGLENLGEIPLYHFDILKGYHEVPSNYNQVVGYFYNYKEVSPLMKWMYYVKNRQNYKIPVLQINCYFNTNLEMGNYEKKINYKVYVKPKRDGELVYILNKEEFSTELVSTSGRNNSYVYGPVMANNGIMRAKNIKVTKIDNYNVGYVKDRLDNEYYENLNNYFKLFYYPTILKMTEEHVFFKWDYKWYNKAFSVDEYFPWSLWFKIDPDNNGYYILNDNKNKYYKDMIYYEDDGYGSYGDPDLDEDNYYQKVNKDIDDLKSILSKTIMTKVLKFKYFNIEVGMIINREGERKIKSQKFIYKGKLFYIKSKILRPYR